MKRARIALLLVMAGTAIANAQEYRVEHSLGYSYSNIDIGNLFPRQNANGWEGSDSVNISKWFAVEDVGGGYYKTFPFTPSATQPTVPHHISDYYAAAGPRINIRPWFLHALVGADYQIGSFFEQSPHAQGGLLTIFGGGVEVPFSVHSHLAFRTTANYSHMNHNFFGGRASTQNNFRVGVALVFRWWRVAPRSSMIASKATAHGMLIPALGIVVGKPQEGEGEGAEVLELMPGSVADLAGLRAGEVISAVDGRPTKTPMELALEMSGKAAGSKIKVEHTTKRYWRSETVVILPNKP